MTLMGRAVPSSGGGGQALINAITRLIAAIEGLERKLDKVTSMIEFVEVVPPKVEGPIKKEPGVGYL